MISEDRAEKALRFLVDTDEAAALAKAEMERAEFAYKRTREAVFTHSTGTVAERQASAMQHESTKDAHERFVQSIALYNKLNNKRDTERIVMDAWRTLQANRRQA